MSRTIDDVRAFVGADKGLATVSSARPNGTVHSSVVNAGVLDHPVDAEPVVGLVVRGSAFKLRHWRTRPHATIVFRAGWSWIGVEGPITLAGPHDDMDGLDSNEVPQLLRDVFTAAGGTHDDWDEYDRVMAEEARTAVFIHAERVTGVGRPGG
jgi:hypothetical protein